MTYNSYSRENSVANKRLYNGKELQKDLGISWYDYGWRNYDPAIARWNQVDPFVDHYEDWSPYNYVQDNPVSRTDPDGRWVNFVVGAIVGAATDYAAQVIVNVAEGKDLGDALTDVDGTSIATSAALGAVTSGASALTKTIGMQAGKQIAKTTTQQVAKQTVKAATATGVKVKKTLEQRAEQLNKTPRPGKDHTKAGKEVVKEQNAAKNGGQTKCDQCGVDTVPAKKHEKGVTPPGNETHVDHVVPKSPADPNVAPGSGTPNNGQVLCRDCNLQKGNN